jgi:homoserine dehydrogenase
MRADLALIGFGHVGRRFAQLLIERTAGLREHHDLDCRVLGISTARHGTAWHSQGLPLASALADGGHLDTLSDPADTPHPQDPFDVIRRLAESDADFRVVIETTTLDIVSGQPAIGYVRAGLDRGCHVVTANKGPVAFAYDSLRSQAASAGLSFLFEVAVMDGVPIINLVRETLPDVRILGFRGVINSTTNHILSAMENGEAFDRALGRMQAEGIAEADPSLDIDGWDAAAKTAALANVLMDARMTPHAVGRAGIDESSGAVARAARAQGRRLRLVAGAARRADGAVDATVAPVELPDDDLLAGLRGQANALLLETDLLGEIAVCQLSGSLTHTAYALLSDLLTIRRRQAPRGAAVR